MSETISYYRSDPTMRRSEAEQKKLRSAKRTLRYIAVVYAFFALTCLAAAILIALSGFFVSPSRGNPPEDEWLTAITAGTIGLILSLAVYAMWTCKRRFRWAALVVSCPLLLMFPVGTLIGGVTVNYLYGRLSSDLLVD